MARLVYQVMQDNAGNLLFGVTGTVRLAGTGTLATIYGDEAGTIPIANPLTNHPSFGSFKFYVGPGSYDLYMAKSGYTFETLTGLQGLGTMALQNASAVAITGGSATGMTALATGASGDVTAGRNLYVTGTTQLAGTVGIGVAPAAALVTLRYPTTVGPCLVVQPFSSDTSGAAALLLLNVASATVGSIISNATSTAFNTTSDVRLKEKIAPLTGALDVVRALNPVTHLWRRDHSPGVGFLANEVQQVVPGVVTGEPEAVDAAGAIVPQQMDLSKLVPWLTAALKEALERIDVLTARLDAAGA